MTSQTEFQECPQCRKLMTISKDRRFWKCKCGNAIPIPREYIVKKIPEVQK